MEPGTCPKCKYDDLDYGKHEIDGQSMSYRLRCSNCGWVGYEVYSVEFTHYAELDRTHVEEGNNG